MSSIFAFLSVLHFRESMGLRGPEHLYLMKEHFAQSLNETEHLEYMESRGGNSYWVDQLLPNTSSLSIIGSTWFIIGYLLAFYHLSYEVEIHAQKLIKYLGMNGHDEKILEILNDELHHSKELYDLWR